jgi:hypothetical protein
MVLVLLFGKDEVAFSLGSDDLPGVRRSYAGFSAAAWESGLSGIYGGIHFMSANLPSFQVNCRLNKSLDRKSFQQI